MSEKVQQTETGNALQRFLKRKNIIFSAKRYGIDALGAMAQGLFASLLIGTIIGTLGEQIGSQVLVDAGGFAKSVAGPAMAISIGYALQAPQLVLFSLLAVGAAANSLGGAGGPLAVLIVAIVAAECGKAVSKETKIDILVTPLVTILSGVLLSMWCAPTIGAAASATGLAGGAAVAGCCAQMVGFAAMSFKENKWSGLISQGLGTSMLQMGNIVKNPRIWIPPTLAAAITGPIATCLFQLQMNGPAVSSGMGTCGLVGQIGVYTGWLEEIAAGSRSQITAFDWIGMILICFVLPAVLSLVFGQILRKIGWIKEDDLKL